MLDVLTIEMQSNGLNWIGLEKETKDSYIHNLNLENYAT